MVQKFPWDADWYKAGVTPGMEKWNAVDEHETEMKDWKFENSN